MPVYLFTYHGKGTWMPDHRKGYVRRKQGVLPPDPGAAAAYRAAQKDDVVFFSADMQQLLVDTARGTEPYLQATVHSVFSEPTHVHVLMSWRHDREWKSMRSSVKTALTKALNAAIERREWWVDSSSRKRVRDREHFDYLITAYRRKHSGVQWVRQTDMEQAEMNRQQARCGGDTR
jgi:hypothetical protein